MKTSILFFLSYFLLIPNLFAADIKNFKGQDIFSNKIIEFELNSKRGMVVVFLSAVCPCSNSHVEELKTLAKKYKNFDFLAIHSNTNEDEAMARTYFEKTQLGFPVIQDNKAQLADLFSAYKTPHVFVLNAQGSILYKGGVSNSRDFSKSDKNFLREALDDIESGKAVRAPEGRTLGCVIAR